MPARKYDNCELGVRPDDWEYAAKAELSKAMFLRVELLARKRATQRNEEENSANAERMSSRIFGRYGQ